ncbi:MAG: hypothetical protein ABMA00_19700, partial [Gemmatimonas sp.]
AAHVIEEFRGEPFGIGVDDTTISTDAPMRYSLPRTGRTRAEDEIDIGAIRLPDGGPDFSGRVFLSLDRVQYPVRLGPSLAHMIFGYTFNRTKVDLPNRHVSSDAIHIHAPHQSALLLGVPGYDDSYHVLLEADRRSMLNSDDKIVTLPKLVGLSGAGVWSYDPSDNEQRASTARLVAIFTEHRQAKYCIGTRLAAHLELVRNSWPDLDEFLPQSRMPSLMAPTSDGI